MNKINSFKDSSFEKKYRSKEKKENNKLDNLEDSSNEKSDSSEEKQENNNLEKVLCNHCGRTQINGIRCLGICVADNDY